MAPRPLDSCWCHPGNRHAGAAPRGPCPVVSASHPAPRQTTGTCGDTKMGARAAKASREHMKLQTGSCAQVGYAKFVGNTKYRLS